MSGCPDHCLDHTQTKGEENMKLHKIRKVDKAVCSCEQKIAYNAAFRAEMYYGNSYRRLPECEKGETILKIADCMMTMYRNGYSYKPGRYNEDAILAALRAGLAAYLEKPFIACDYDAIGTAFPVA